MISQQKLRNKAKELKLRVDMVEKDYILGWILYGVANSSAADRLVFKGGTALSKVYFPGEWRLSEDLDFTLADNTEWEEFVRSLDAEVPDIVKKAIRL